MCLCPNFDHDPDCDPPGLQAPACDACGSTEDIVPYQGVPLCVACTAKQREEDELVEVIESWHIGYDGVVDEHRVEVVVPVEDEAVPVAVDIEETEELPAETMTDVVEGGLR